MIKDKRSVEWPLQCKSCGKIYESPEDPGVGSGVFGGTTEVEYRIYTCLNCVSPSILKESNFMSKVKSKFSPPQNYEEGFLGIESTGF